MRGAAHGNRAIARKRRDAPKVAAHIITAVDANHNTQLSVAATTEWQAAVQTNRFVAIAMELNEIDDLLSKLE